MESTFGEMVLVAVREEDVPAMRLRGSCIMVGCRSDDVVLETGGSGLASGGAPMRQNLRLAEVVQLLEH
uniref:Uncharacterized protein n=1 Tax=Oryza glumipatula TaxID=40148 RepID=A0A0E0B0Q6_9ORYZ